MNATRLRLGFRSANHRVPIVCAVIALGVLIVAVALARARDTETLVAPLFWGGLALMFAAAAIALFASDTTRRDRIRIALFLGLSLYAVKILREPWAFTFPDEFSNWRSAQDTIAAQSAFRPNPLQPILQYYPGLSLSTSALQGLSGASVYVAGTVLVGTARLMLVGALFLLFERATLSARWAGVATLIYMANPNFLYEGSQFAYESLGIPLVIGTLWLASRSFPFFRTRGMILGVGLALLSVVVTHHLSAYALCAFLALWAFVDYWPAKWVSAGPPDTTFVLAAMGAAVTAVWLALAAPATIDYLAPRFEDGTSEVVNLVTGGGATRTPFTSAGVVAPAFDRVVGILAVLILLAGLGYGVLLLRKRKRLSSLMVAMTVVAAAYPVTILFRLSEEGQELASRASEYIFIGIAPVLAAVGIAIYDRLGANRRMLVIVAVSFLFIGGVSVGFAYYARFPGPYEVSAGSRSVRSDMIDASNWAYSNLGPGNRIAADRVGGKEMGVYGEQHPVSAAADSVNVGPLFFGPELRPREVRILQRGRIDDVVVDQRLTTGLPLDGIYIEDGEPGDGRRRLTVKELGKFAKSPKISRVFDSGDIKIYDVRPLSR